MADLIPNKTNFSLDSFISDIAYPVEEVVVYTDGYSANEKLKLLEKRHELDKAIADYKKPVDATLADGLGKVELMRELDKITDEIAEWDEKLKASAITFVLQGMAPEIVKTITEQYFVDEKSEADLDVNNARDNELIAKSIISVKPTYDENAEPDLSIFTPERVEHLRGKLLSGEFVKLVRAVAQVNLNGALFIQAVDAPFPS